MSLPVAISSSPVSEEIDPTLAALQEEDSLYAFQNYGPRLPVAFTHGRGAYLYDTRGQEYLDFLAGISVTQVGHAHPHVVAAIAHQAGTLIHLSNYFYMAPQVKLAKRLSGLTYGFRAFFCNSGTEANEAAIKVARRWQYSNGHPEKVGIVSMLKSFHGRTMGALAATGNGKYQEGFAPLPAGFSQVEFNDVVSLQAAVGPDTAAIILEPILGESGVLTTSNEMLTAARRLCDEFGALLIFDEVQSGNGRTGKFWAHEWTPVRPDILTTAKGLANGVPIGAVLAREDVSQALTPGSHGTTFGGNLLATAAANATLDVIEGEGLMNNAGEVGAYFHERLQAWGLTNGEVAEVRGRGLMLGVEMKRPIARTLMLAALRRGLVFNAVGDSILRFLPPLIITRAEVDAAINRLTQALGDVNEEAA